MKSLGKTVPLYLLAISLPLLVGGAAAVITADSMNAYETMAKPPLSPPGWVFPVVWTLLYALMGLASGLVADSGHPQRKKPLRLYGLQLLVNFMWPIVFFRWEMPFAALLLLIFLFILVLALYRQFRLADRIAGWMIVPYLLWLVVALWLNLGIWWLNR